MGRLAVQALSKAQLVEQGRPLAAALDAAQSSALDRAIDFGEFLGGLTFDLAVEVGRELGRSRTTVDDYRTLWEGRERVRAAGCTSIRQGLAVVRTHQPKPDATTFSFTVDRTPSEELGRVLRSVHGKSIRVTVRVRRRPPAVDPRQPRLVIDDGGEVD